MTERLVFKDGEIFDGRRVIRGDLVVEGSLIKGIQNELAGGETRVYDCAGKTIIPGLIDLHVHTTMLTDEEAAGVTAQTIASSILRGAQYLQEAVKYGVTTIRDCGSKHAGIFALRNRVEEGAIRGPEMYLSGCALRSTGGHADRVAITADGEVEIIREVRRQIKSGADWIKLMLTGGTATPGEKITDVQYSLEELRAAAGEAHRKSTPVCAHISNLQGAELAVEAGIDCIQHGIDLSEELIEKMVEKGTSLVPCTYLTHRESIDKEIPAYIREKAGEIRDRQLESFFAAYKKGVRCGVGTDADGLYHPFGESMIWELEWLVRNGLEPVEALELATCLNADILKADRIGQIKEGYQADLVVINGRPHEDIKNLRKIELVVKKGEIFDPQGRGLQGVTK